MTETKLSGSDVSLLETLLGKELVLVQTDTTNELQSTLRGVAGDAELSLDSTAKTALRDTENNRALLLVALGTLGRDDHGEKRLEVGVENTLGDIVGVLQSLGSGGERKERGERHHAVEGVPVIDRVLELLGASSDLLLEVDLVEAVAGGALKEDVREGARHCCYASRQPIPLLSRRGRGGANLTMQPR